MNRELSEGVWQRAGNCCEYCRMPQEFDAATFEIDHIISVAHGGTSIGSNLCLSCFFCNRYKGTNLAGIDPVTRRLTGLFHPRRHVWTYHFRWQGEILLGRTAIGRTTIRVLNINDGERVLSRSLLMAEGVFSKE